jgi:hypothetical protein
VTIAGFSNQGDVEIQHEDFAIPFGDLIGLLVSLALHNTHRADFIAIGKVLSVRMVSYDRTNEKSGDMLVIHTDGSNRSFDLGYGLSTFECSNAVFDLLEEGSMPGHHTIPEGFGIGFDEGLLNDDPNAWSDPGAFDSFRYGMLSIHHMQEQIYDEKPVFPQRVSDTTIVEDEVTLSMDEVPMFSAAAAETFKKNEEGYDVTVV